MRFDRKTALVTGAASGIGLATARHLAAEGAERLILIDRDAGALDRIDLPCPIEALTGDVADEAFWDAHSFDGLDLAVANAGIAAASSLAITSLADWRRVMAVNLDGAFLTLRSAMRAMKGRGGAIVATASAAGVKAEPGTAAYGTSKAALIHLVKIAAKEGARDRIRVNAIAPSGVETPVWEQVPQFAARIHAIGRDAAFAEMAAATTPLGRYAKAEEVAAQIAFLLSDEAALVTGACLVSDGGYTL